MTDSLVEATGQVAASVGDLASSGQKAMNQDAAMIEMFTQNMNEMSRKIMENSVSPYLGRNIDVTT